MTGANNYLRDASHSEQHSWYEDQDSSDSYESSDDKLSEQMIGEPQPAAQRKEKGRRTRLTIEQSQILESEF